jgi:predicted MFS family arabinose efflux permease
VVAAFLSLMDRLVLNLLVDPIRADLHISESQFGLVQGASFAVVSSLLAVPLGLAADRVNRSRLLIASVAVWSVATALGGLAGSYPEFLAARILVGLGEAALWPVAVSMIADILPSYWRGRAIGLLILAQIFGSGASLQIGGWILRLVSVGAFAGIPVLASLPGWRIVLVCCGGLGVIGVALLLTIPEPVRRGSAPAGSERAGLRSFLDHVSRHRTLFTLIYAGALLVAISGSASGAWAPSVYIRHFHLTPAQVGPRLGLIAIGSGILGAIIGGWVSDRLEQRVGVYPQPRNVLAKPLPVLRSDRRHGDDHRTAGLRAAAVPGARDVYPDSVHNHPRLQHWAEPRRRNHPIRLRRGPNGWLCPASRHGTGVDLRMRVLSLCPA